MTANAKPTTPAAVIVKNMVLLTTSETIKPHEHALNLPRPFRPSLPLVSTSLRIILLCHFISVWEGTSTTFLVAQLRLLEYISTCRDLTLRHIVRIPFCALVSSAPVDRERCSSTLACTCDKAMVVSGGARICYAPNHNHHHHHPLDHKHYNKRNGGTGPCTRLASDSCAAWCSAPDNTGRQRVVKPARPAKGSSRNNTTR